ncbi:uncharacterized protein LOC143150683 [Ptiloglossa arizonensis]|uniref:uncharacterized protein LOC143150683 n=1 Tax=Ptiloglossa arizonensis TaxID=3350558 RepID=UPI003F9FEA3A
MDYPGSHYYEVNRILLTAVGLWPHQKHKFLKLGHTVIILVLLSGTFFQVTVFITTKVNPKLFFEKFSFVIFTITFALKYVMFLFNLKDLKQFLTKIEYDWNTITNEDELRIIHHYSRGTKTLTVLFMFVVYPSPLVVAFGLFKNHLLDIFVPLNETRPRIIPISVEYFVDKEKYFYLIVVHIIFFLILGTTVLLATESTSMVGVRHVCALFKVVSHRLDKMFVPNIPGISLAERNFIIHKRLGLIIDLHVRIFKYIGLIRDKFAPTYFLLLILGMLCLALSIFRLSVALTIKTDMDDLMTSLFCAISTSSYIFIACHFAQELIDHNYELFKVACNNTHWYDIPPREQKILLIVMLNSVKNVTVLLGGIFTPSYEGYSVIMKTCFSYAMTLHSPHHHGNDQIVILISTLHSLRHHGNDQIVILISV